MNAIEVKEFYKSYGSIEAVRGIDLTVKPGELFGLIGPDGAGKTTLIRTICTLLVPDRGIITVNGLDVTKNVTKIRSLLGYMPQRFSLYPDLSVQQNLHFFADLFQVPESERVQRIQDLYRFSRLAPFKSRKAAALSGGMKQKLALSCALVHTPDILILDEPTFGVDPVSRQEFWQILHSIREGGTTIVVSTAYMDEAAQCDRVALFHQGKIVGLDTPEQLKQEYPYPLFRVAAGNLRRVQEYFASLQQIQAIQLFGDVLHISFTNIPSEQDWRNWKEETGGELENWQPQPPSIEDIFLNLMGENR